MGVLVESKDTLKRRIGRDVEITNKQSNNIKSQNPILEEHGNLEKRLKVKRLLHYHELEAWQQDNHYIQTHYRPATAKFVASLRSLFHIHNQTVNIYSHLLGFIIYLVVASALFTIFHARYPMADRTDVLIFTIFFSGLCVFLGLSAAFHTFGNHSHEIRSTFLVPDMVGIIFLIIGSFYPSVYYGFYCEPELTKIYCTMITIFGLGALLFTLAPRFRDRSWRHVRTALFMSMGLSGIAPMTHAALKFGIPQARKQIGWAWYIGEGVFYVSGAIIYASKIPERYVQGKFDVWGSSHQIFHIAVLLGAASHLTGAVKAFDWNHDPATRRC